MSKSRKKDYNDFDDNDEIDFKQKKQGLKFGKNGKSRFRRDKMTSNQIIKSYQNGKLNIDDE